MPFPRERQQVLHNTVATPRFVLDALQVPVRVLAVGPVQQQLRVSDDPGEGVVELVGHAADELAHRRELFGLKQPATHHLRLPFRTATLGHIATDDLQERRFTRAHRAGRDLQRQLPLVRAPQADLLDPGGSGGGGLFQVATSQFRVLRADQVGPPHPRQALR